MKRRFIARENQIFKKDQSPAWQDSRHSTCIAHLFLVRTDLDLCLPVIHQRPEYIVRKTFPLYSIYWETGWLRYSLWYEALSYLPYTGMEYQLSIQITRSDGKFDMFLICVFCNTLQMGSLASPTIAKVDSVTISGIALAWGATHKDHFGLPITSVIPDVNMNIFSLDVTLAKAANATLNTTKLADDLDYGFITRIYVFSKHNIDQMMLEPFYLTYQIDVHSLVSDTYSMVTVVKKSSLKEAGWRAVFVLFQPKVWMLIVLSFLSVYWTVCRVENRTLAFSGSIFLTLLVSLLDHSHPLPRKHRSDLIVICWAILCMALTVLYGDDLAASMSILDPPHIQHELIDLGNYNYLITSKDDLVDWDEKSYSLLGISLQRLTDVSTTIISQKERNTLLYRIAKKQASFVPLKLASVRSVECILIGCTVFANFVFLMELAQYYCRSF